MINYSKKLLPLSLILGFVVFSQAMGFNSNWIRATANAGFSERSDYALASFKNGLWLIGGYNGTTGHSDVWMTTDGTNWNSVTNAAPFGNRWESDVTVFQNKLWLAGGFTGAGTLVNDVWWTSDGTNWNQATNTATFKREVRARA